MLSSSSKSLQHLGLKHATSAISLLSNYTTEVDVPANVPQPRVSSKQTAQFRKGAGGRASFSGNVVTVFGASGQIGNCVVNQLAKSGNQLIIPYRSDPYYVKELKVVGDLGQILFFPFRLADEESIRKAVKYSNIVINLIGTRNPSKQFSMDDVHHQGARRIAKVCREMGVERLVHISALNADPDYKPVFYKKAQLLKTKGLGETAVREEFPDAVIIRPGVVYGEYDNFIFPLLNRFRKSPLDWVYMYKAGEETYKMPIYIDDVSLGIRKAALDPTVSGKTFEFVGPHCYKLGELADFMFARARVVKEFGYRYKRHGFFDPWFFGARVLTGLYNKIYTARPPRINMEWLEFTEGASDVLTGALTLADLGIHRLAEFEYLGGYYAHQRSFMPELEEDLAQMNVEDPPLPLRSPPIFKQKFTNDSPKIRTDKKSFGVEPFVPIRN